MTRNQEGKDPEKNTVLIEGSCEYPGEGTKDDGERKREGVDVKGKMGCVVRVGERGVGGNMKWRMDVSR